MTDPFEAHPESVRPLHTADKARAAPFEMAARDALPVPVPILLPVPIARPRRTLLKLFGGSLAAFAVGAIGVQSWQFVADLLGTTPAIGAVLGAALAAATASGAALVLREGLSYSREMRKLREVEDLVREATALLNGAGHGKALGLAARIVKPLRDRADLAPSIQYFRGAATTAHSDRQVLDLLADNVIRPLDRQAYQAVSRAARDAGLGVTMSPFGILDAGIVLWRGLRMVREVAAIYGFRPGFFARGALIRRVVYTAATQGAADFVADAVLSHVGARLAGMVSARVGEGMLTSMRTARLGVITMAACRPLPFLDEDKASIARLGTEIAASLGGSEERR